MGQSLIRSCTVISLWSWLAASSSLSEPHAGALRASLLLSDDALQKQRSTSASPCKSWPVSGQGFALSLLHAGQTPAVFLMLSVSKCQRKDAFLQCFSFSIHLLTLSSVMLLLQPSSSSFFFSTFLPILPKQLVFLVEKLFSSLETRQKRSCQGS